MHPRTEIRNAIVKRLRDFVDTNIPIYLSRPNPLFLPELPAILLYFRNEDPKMIVGDANFPKVYERIMSINVDIILEGAKDPDAELDRIALQVENSFFFDPTLSGICYGTTLATTIPITIECEGDRNVECQRLTWQTKYQSEGYLPQRMDDFLLASADIIDPTLDQFMLGSLTQVRTKWPSL